MPRYSQAGRAVAVTTPLGPDALLLEQLTGSEALSELFHFRLDLLAERPVDFGRVLGQKASARLQLPNGTGRFFHGIVSRFAQGPQVAGPDGKATFVRYRAELVPRLWLLTRRVRSRIFQRQSAPEILKAVLHDDWKLPVTFQLGGRYPARNFCVQYRESDFAFVSRLMEDEGICYYFEHTADEDTLIVTDATTDHPRLPSPASVAYDPTEGGLRDGPRVRGWEKAQEVCPGRYTLWDHHFQLPQSNLEAHQSIADSVAAGAVTHALRPQADGELEVYEYPGRFAHRFDGIDKDGGEQPKDLEQVFQENRRVAAVRMEQEAARSLRVTGEGDCGAFAPGYLFALTRHFDADGSYLLTRVEHSASLEGVYTTGGEVGPVYANTFTAIPEALPFRPPRVTPRPRVEGAQTATVVGVRGEEIFTDKFGRVKVQFHWDRRGVKDADSSCWLRVVQPWAGKTWGALTLPRVGQEVVVAFLEGDPDRPIILGGVYNAEQMPPYRLPDQRRQSGLVSSSGPGADQFHEIRLDDTAGRELLHLHSERDLQFQAENNKRVQVGNCLITEIGLNHKAAAGSGAGGGIEDDTPTNLPDERIPAGTVQVQAVYGDTEQVNHGDIETKIYGDTTTYQEGSSTSTFHGNLKTFVIGFDNTFIAGECTEWIGGLYICAVGGSQQYLTLVNYFNFVFGFNVNLVIGFNMSFVFGPAHINVVRGSTYDFHEGSFTKVSAMPISMATPATIQMVGSAVLIDADAIILRSGDSMVSVTPAGIMLSVAEFLTYIALATEGTIETTGIVNQGDWDVSATTRGVITSATNAMQEFE